MAGVVQSRTALIAMHLRLGVLPRLWRFSAKLTPQPINMNLRDQIKLSFNSAGGFAEFLAESVSRHLPTVYLEGFKNLTEQTFSENVLSKPPRAIFTNTLLHRSEQFKLWCATFVTQSKTKLFSGQHGGGYGLSRFPNWTELNEHAIVDGFLGWGKFKSSNIDFGSCVQANSNNYKPNYSGKLLVVLGPVTRQQNNFNLGNVHCNSSYYESINEFLHALDIEKFSSVVVRPKVAHAKGKPARVSVIQIAEVFGKSIKLDLGSESLERSLSESRLAVVTYNETTIPANLMANFPTIALWDPKYVRLNDRAAAVYDELLKAKILFHSPTDAAHHVATIWLEVNKWWSSKIVQSARLNYCDHYAHKVRFPALTVASVIADNL
jgi:putative transferase (TIGR04331 family)